MKQVIFPLKQFFVIPLAVFCNALFLLVWKLLPDLIEKARIKIIERNAKKPVKLKHEQVHVEILDEHHEEHHENVHIEDQHQENLIASNEISVVFARDVINVIISPTLVVKFCGKSKQTNENL